MPGFALNLPLSQKVNTGIFQPADIDKGTWQGTIY